MLLIILIQKSQKENQFRNSQKMQRVPQIRIFGSSAQQWRKSSVDKYQKKFVETWASSTLSPFAKTYKQPWKSQNHFSSMKRSSSVTKINNFSPFETNYYANAIKICEQNRVLKKINGHGIEYLNSAYIVKGCKRPSKKQCLQCQAQMRSRIQTKESCYGHNLKANIQTENRFQSYQNSYRASQQSDTNYMNYQQEEQINSKRNGVLKNKDFETPKAANSAKKIVSFQQIIMSQNQQKQHTFRPQNENQPPKFKQISTQRSTQEDQNNKKVVIIESFCQTMADRQKEIMNKKESNQKNYLIPEISQLINELNIIGYLDEFQSKSFMLDELKEAARNDLQVRKNCINQLDDIIGRFGSK